MRTVGLGAALRTVNASVPWVLACAGGWAAYQLLLQNGRLLLRVEALEQRLVAVPTLERRLALLEAGASPPPQRMPGFEPGTRVPDFELPDLEGQVHRLTQWQGKRLLLIFFNPESPFCQQLLPVLTAMPEDPRRLPIVITRGPAAVNRALFKRYAFPYPVLLQEHDEVATLLGVPGTPVAYALDERHSTIGTAALGLEQVLALMEAGQSELDTGASGEGAMLRRALPPIQHPNLQVGLAVGTPAPRFRLPRLDGGELSPDTYLGRRLLLVFSDPQCEPCDALARDLEALHLRNGDLQIAMISRGTEEANRNKVDALGVTFPVALQRHWEVSRDYGRLATPIAYLIDEQGAIAAPLAMGKEEILTLVDAAAIAP